MAATTLLLSKRAGMRKDDIDAFLSHAVHAALQKDDTRVGAASYGLQWRQPHFCYQRGRVRENTTLTHFCHMQYMQHCRRMTRGWGQPVMDYNGGIHTFVIKDGGYEK